MNEIELLRVVKAEIARAGSQAAAATQMGISASYLSDVLNKRRDVGESILSHLGIEKVVTYRRRKNGKA